MKLTYVIYSSIRGTIIDYVEGYQAARKRAGKMWCFAPLQQCIIESTAYGRAVTGVKP